DRDPQAETAALAAVAAWATQFTPAVSLAPPDAVLAEIGGSLRLFGGLPQIANQFARGAHDLGYAARLAFAPTPTAALLFARTGENGGESGVRYDFSSNHVVTAGVARKVVSDPTFPTFESLLQNALAPLPLSQLDVEPDAIEFLAAAGITTFAEACALPRDALARRVGAAFVATLDRARGLVADPRVPF